MMLVLGGLWLATTRASIHEEIEAAARVCQQWLDVLASEARHAPSPLANQRLLNHIKAAGRIRANAIEIIDATGQLVYQSPQPLYKAGRASPAWFAHLTEPVFAQRRINAGTFTLIITPDSSRAGLDAWDNLCSILVWMGMLLVVLFLAVRWALNRALHPLDQIRSALECTGQGCFDTRLPPYASPDLNRLAHAFNGMADRLNEAVQDNVRLECARALAQQLQDRLEAERHSIAQELHDELAQGITAVRAMAGAIVQRASAIPTLKDYAQNIIAVTNQIQDGIRHILHRLRSFGTDKGISLNQALQRYLQLWRQYYPDLALQVEHFSEPLQVEDELALTVIRLVQEGLTNVVRHACATQVQLQLHCTHQEDNPWLELTLTDNGRGLEDNHANHPGCGLGLIGMRERVVALRGELSISSIPGGGVCLHARFPMRTNQTSPAPNTSSSPSPKSCKTENFP